MKIKEGFKLRTICGQHVVSPEGTGNVNFSKLITLNDTAAYLFGKLVEAGEFTPEQMALLSTRSKIFAFACFTAGRLGVPFFLLISGYLLLTG